MLDRIEQGKVGVWRMEYPVEEPRLVDLREEDGRPNCSTASPLPGPRSCTLSKLCTPSTGVGRASRVRGHVPAEWGRLRLRRGELEPECDSSNRPDMSGEKHGSTRSAAVGTRRGRGSRMRRVVIVIARSCLPCAAPWMSGFGR